MELFFSASTGGFYSSELHGEHLPADAVSISEEQHAALLAAQAAGQRIVADGDGNPVAAAPEAPSREQQQAALQLEVQGWLDGVARQHGYSNILSAVSYADEPAVQTFQAEGRAFRAWRSQVWAAANAALAADALPVATTLLDSLPRFVAGDA